MSRDAIFRVTAALVIVLMITGTLAPDPASLKVQGPDTLGNPMPVFLSQPGASGLTQTPLTASSTGGNASNAASLGGAANLTTYITGFECTASGATAGLPVTVTVTGTITGTLNYTFTFPAGVLVGANPLVVEFTTPIPASATNTAIVVTLPAGGAGNTNASCTAHGFRQ